VDAAELPSLRDRAIRVLGEDVGEYEMVRQLYATLSPIELRDRVIRVVGDGGGAAAEAWLKAIVENGQEQAALRDRAMRVLAEQGRQRSLTWLLAIARDESQNAELRDRAVRLWAEAGASTADLTSLYDATKTAAIRQRLIRLLAERSDDAAIEKLIAVAKGDPDESLRRQAVRRLAESGDPRAKQFLEEAVRDGKRR
jgi:HEAT repeat protein